MRRTAKRAGFLAALSTLLTIVASPGTASAGAANPPKWVSDPATCTNIKTVAERTSGNEFLQLRTGKCYGTRYVWTRANGNHTVGLGINRGTERIGTNWTQNGSGRTHYTKGRRTDAGLWFVGGDVPWTTAIGWP